MTGADDSHTTDPRTAAARSSAMELAVLGLLADTPVHGYELRRTLSAKLGSLRMLSFGSLYPMLRRMQAGGWVTTEDEHPDPDAVPLTSKKSRVVYRLTADGKERLAELLGDAGPQSWSDDGFEVHLAFFSRTCAEDRVRILEGRRRRVEEKRERLRNSFSLAQAANRLDQYTDQLRQLGLEASEREVRWLNELIATERASASEHGLPRASASEPGLSRASASETVTERASASEPVTERASASEADPTSE